MEWTGIPSLDCLLLLRVPMRSLLELGLHPKS